jgi:hypothetical protein
MTKRKWYDDPATYGTVTLAEYTPPFRTSITPLLANLMVVASLE